MVTIMWIIRNNINHEHEMAIILLNISILWLYDMINSKCLFVSMIKGIKVSASQRNSNIIYKLNLLKG